MRAHIYIRKENQKKWESISSPSAWVNSILHYLRTGYVDFSTPEDAQKALMVMAVAESGEDPDKIPTEDWGA